MSTTASTLVADALRRVQPLSPTEFADEVDTGTALIVDLREADERVRAGSIRGAIHMPRGMLEFRADPTSSAFDARLQPDRRILLYCSTGDRSALAADTLSALGFADVAHLDGGLRSWSSAGLPLFGGQVDPY